MEHYAIFSAPFPSHICVLEALASELLDKGHRVTWIHQIDIKNYLSDQRISYFPVGLASHPKNSLASTLNRAAHPRGLLGVRRVIADMASHTAMLCSEAPAAVSSLGITLVIADQMEAAGGLVADSLRLPYVSVACALPVNREPTIPLPVMPWAYATSEQAVKLNAASARIYDWMMKPHAQVISAYAKAFGLPYRRSMSDCLSLIAQISQTTQSFDFPRSLLPAQFHHVGPLRKVTLNKLPFDFAVDQQRPFVFASLGTLQGGRIGLFTRIAQACQAAGFQLLVAHCNHLNAHEEQALKKAGATWVTGFVDQHSAVTAADVVITHGGLNTVMDALAAGTPLLVLPIAFDQPGVAARVAFSGAGLYLTPRQASTKAIARALGLLVGDSSFESHAKRVGSTIASAGGVQEAARIVMSVSRNSRVVPHNVKSFVHHDVLESKAYAA